MQWGLVSLHMFPRMRQACCQAHAHACTRRHTRARARRIWKWMATGTWCLFVTDVYQNCSGLIGNGMLHVIPGKISGVRGGGWVLILLPLVAVCGKQYLFIHPSNFLAAPHFSWASALNLYKLSCFLFLLKRNKLLCSLPECAAITTKYMKN